VFEGWYGRTPEGFGFALKVSRLITHVRLLKECENEIGWFFENARPLREKTCACLFQLPPAFSPEPGLLSEFISSLPEGWRYVFEFRNGACYGEEMLDVLRKHRVGFCIHDYPGRESPLVVTADMVYVRFHGAGARYAGSYPAYVLERWAERILKWGESGKDVYAYFNNDAGGEAVQNALALRELLRPPPGDTR